jgi:DNA-binding CsgD family transcriptional regulator
MQGKTESNIRSDRAARWVGAAATAVLGARDEGARLQRIFDQSQVPMVMVDDGRRYVEANRLAQLWFRMSLDELRSFGIGELTPAPPTGAMDRAWARLLAVGCVAGRYPVEGSDGRQRDIVYYGLANVRPELHLIAFAPAHWPEDDLDAFEDDRAEPSAPLTPQEIRVLELAANGLSGPEVAQELVLSPSTVHTHFENIYVKLDVRNRGAAVARAMRLGLIE